MFITPDLIEGLAFIGAVAIVYFTTIVLKKKIAKLDEKLAQDFTVPNQNEQKNAA